MYFLHLLTYLSSCTILYHPLFKLRCCNVLSQGSENDLFASLFSLSGRILFDLCSRDPVACPTDGRASQEIPETRDIAGHRTSPDDVYNISIYTWFGTT